VIKLQGKLPRQLWLAVSGGVDSMAALDFLRRRHDVHAIHFNHGTAHAQKAEEFVKIQCAKYNVPLMIGRMEDIDVDFPPPRKSKEEWWRECRYKFFDQFFTVPVVTCHHLDDCVETWVMSSMHGTGKWVPYRRNHVIRPFRLTRKRDLELWARLNNVDWIEDDSNADINYTRNYIRHEMMPHVLRVNPGIYKTIKKKVMEDAVDV
jgi:tRNA(Ile)-lysidine synthase